MSHFYDVTARFWDELVAQSAGPLAFRFMLQLAVASALAALDGYRDARDGRAPYLWTILHIPRRRRSRLVEGMRAFSRVFLLGATLDVLYQIAVLNGLRLTETIEVVVVLAFVPYLFARGPAQRIFRRRLQLLRYPDRHPSFRHG